MNKLTASRSPTELKPRPSAAPPTALPARATRDASWRYWPLALIPAILLAAAGAVIGISRAPTYTASARLAVGSMTISAQAVPGAVQAYQQLAADFSREISAQAVQQRADQLAPQAKGSLSATPVPSSSIINVTATGKSTSSAVQRVNAGAQALQSYVQGASQSSGVADNLLNQYRDAAGRYSKLAARAGQPGLSQSQVASLNGQLAAAKLERDTLGAMYQTSRQASAAGGGMQLLNSASSASSDRASVAERLALIGLVAGLAIGVALAWALAARATRRQA